MSHPFLKRVALFVCINGSIPANRWLSNCELLALFRRNIQLYSNSLKGSISVGLYEKQVLFDYFYIHCMYLQYNLIFSYCQQLFDILCVFGLVKRKTGLFRPVQIPSFLYKSFFLFLPNKKLNKLANLCVSKKSQCFSKQIG